MKKSHLKFIAFALILAIAMPFSFFACGGDTGSGDTPTTEATVETPIEEVTPEPTPEPTTPEPTEPPTTEAPTEPPTDPAERPEPDENGIIAGYRYYLWSPNSNLYLQVEKESKYTGFTQEAFTGEPNQMFVFYPLGDGKYKIWAVGTKARYLDTEYADGETDGALLVATETPEGEGSQEWTLKTQSKPTGVENLTFSIMSVISDNKRCVDVEGVSKDEGHQIHMWAGGTSANQKWVFELVADKPVG